MSRKIPKKYILLMAAVILLPFQCLAQDLSLADRINYKKVKLMTAIGTESTVLVNRFTGKVEFAWNGSSWTPAPPIFQANYDNRRNISRRLNELKKRFSSSE